MQVNDYPDCEKGSSQMTNTHKEEETIDEQQKRSDLSSLNDVFQIQCLNGGKLAGKLLENAPLNPRKK